MDNPNCNPPGGGTWVWDPASTTWLPAPPTELPQGLQQAGPTEIPAPTPASDIKPE